MTPSLQRKVAGTDIDETEQEPTKEATMQRGTYEERTFAQCTSLGTLQMENFVSGRSVEVAAAARAADASIQDIVIVVVVGHLWLLLSAA